MDWLNKYSEDVPKAQQGKTIAKKPITTQDSATRQDSLNVYNNAIKIEKYYNNKKYKLLGSTFSLGKELFNNNDFSAKEFKRDNFAKLPTKNGKVTYQAYPFNSYRQNIDINRYQQRDNANTIIDTRAPIQLFDKRINPQLSEDYMNTDSKDQLVNDAIQISKYIPLAVKPFDLLTSKEKEQRVKQYGRNGVPNSYNPANTNKSVIQPITNKNNIDKKPIYVSSKNDPRYKAYQDSLSLYKKSATYVQENNKTDLIKTFHNYIDKEDAESDARGSKILPIKRIQYDSSAGNYHVNTPIYKKPNQPVLLKPRNKINPIENTLQPIGIQNNNQEFTIDTNMRQVTPQLKYYNVTDKVNQNFGGSESNYRFYPQDGNPLQELSKEKYEDGTPYNERTMVPVFQDGGVIAKTQGQLNAFLKEKKLKLHKQQLESNPNQLSNESNSDYAKREKYNAFRVKQVEDNNYTKSLYNEMDASQKTDKNFFTKAIRQVGTSPIHVANYLSDLIDLPDTQKYKNNKVKAHDFIKGVSSAADVAALYYLPSLDFGLKNTESLGKQVYKMGVTQAAGQGAQNAVQDLINYSVDSFQNGGELDKFGTPITSKIVESSNDRSHYDNRMDTLMIGNDARTWANKEDVVAHENYHAIQHKQETDNFDIAHYPNKALWARIQKRPELPSTEPVWDNFYNRKALETKIDINNFKNEYPDSQFVPNQIIFDKHIDNEQYDNPNSMEGEALQYELGERKFQNGGTIPKLQNDAQLKKDSPEYAKAWKEGNVQNLNANGEENPYWGGQLDEVVVQAPKKEKGFWEQSRDKYLEEHRDDGVLGAIGTVATYPLALGQHALTYAGTNKVQNPSEAWGYNTKEDWFDSPLSFGKSLVDGALNIGLDPVNLVGGEFFEGGPKLLDGLANLKRLPHSVSPEMLQGMELNGFKGSRQLPPVASEIHIPFESLQDTTADAVNIIDNPYPNYDDLFGHIENMHQNTVSPIPPHADATSVSELTGGSLTQQELDGIRNTYRTNTQGSAYPYFRLPPLQSFRSSQNYSFPPISSLSKQGFTDILNSTPKEAIQKLGTAFREAKQTGSLNPKSIFYNLQKELPGDSWHHAFFSMTPKEVSEKVNGIIGSIPKGKQFRESSLSTDSFRLLTPQMGKMTKDYDIIATGKFNKLNDYGRKGNELRALHGEEKGNKEVIDLLSAYTNRLSNNLGKKIPSPKIINNQVYIPEIIAQKKGGSLTTHLARNKPLIKAIGAAGAVAGAEAAAPYINSKLFGDDKVPKKKNGGIIEDDMGQWNHPGEITKINSNTITMKNVRQPLLGISDTGHMQIMHPEQDYNFKGKTVTEIPLIFTKNNSWLSKYE